MKWENTLFAFEKDIESRGFWDWMRAHTSWMKPLHRYEGLLEITEDKLLLVGEDKEEGEIELEIPVDRIDDVQFGFDETFSRGEDRQLGLFGFAPLRIRYESEEGEKKLYLFADFGRFPIRNCDNERVLEKLNEARGDSKR
ncbi:hypothetical protein AKJ51_01595 [candidate division MSBL1 archaeon SCGC-AAA382A20]|uniref:Uncharacterized protein n=1 Tax=candidate division MSBL1 archaeon SCGC-AAA382A20 TaxID=1698280 RepID=A0A133VLJ7_9EURY|nr:hypothetical protein AKJ51_01595 [candidate division MSBL1 archaeon SCGC-AAA382A20]